MRIWSVASKSVRACVGQFSISPPQLSSAAARPRSVLCRCGGHAGGMREREKGREGGANTPFDTTWVALFPSSAPMVLVPTKCDIIVTLRINASFPRFPRRSKLSFGSSAKRSNGLIMRKSERDGPHMTAGAAHHPSRLKVTNNLSIFRLPIQ